MKSLSKPKLSKSKNPKDRSRRTPDDPEQYLRFLEAAKEAGADETPKGADKAFGSVAKPRKPNGS